MKMPETTLKKAQNTHTSMQKLHL